MRKFVILISLILLFTNCETDKNQLTIWQVEEPIKNKNIDPKWLSLNQEIINEILANTNITDKDIKFDKSGKLINTLYYYASANPAATMYFYENGILIFNSEWYSKNIENRFFLWKPYSNSGIQLTFIDKRSYFDVSVKIAEWHLKYAKGNIYSIDISKKQIVYGFTLGGLFFEEYNFYPKEDPYK